MEVDPAHWHGDDQDVGVEADHQSMKPLKATKSFKESPQ
jgi:hypothetical protein